MSHIRELSLDLPAVAEAVRTTRAAIDALPLDGHPQARFDLRLLVTEILCDILHPTTAALSGNLAFTISVDTARVRVEATAPRRPNAPTVIERPHHETHGRGLLLLDALADDWGIGRDGNDRSRIWFELLLVDEPRRAPTAERPSSAPADDKRALRCRGREG